MVAARWFLDQQMLKAKRAGFLGEPEGEKIGCTHCENTTMLVEPDQANHSLDCRYHARNMRSASGISNYTILAEGAEKEITKEFKFRESADILDATQLDTPYDGPIVNVNENEDAHNIQMIYGYCQSCKQYVANNICLPCGCINVCDSCFAQQCSREERYVCPGSGTRPRCNQLVKGIMRWKGIPKQLQRNAA